jgi:hypothetical protein
MLCTIAVATLAGLAGGCHLPAHAPCGAGDAQTLGYQDGSQGLDESRLLAHQSACAEGATRLDADAYRLGWSEGVARYCAPASAFELGSSGASYRNVCPEPAARTFRDHFYAGRQLHNARVEIAELETLLVLRSEEHARVSEALARAERHLVRADAGATEREQWLAQTKSLVREQRDLESDIDALERDIRVHKDDLELLRSSLADTR